MADEDRQGTPPGGWKWDHEMMREAAQRPVTGPASTDTLAASGGLELPAHESHPLHPSTETREEPIPGERDPGALTARPVGAIGGRFSGADTPSPEPEHVMDRATLHDREIEGGKGQGDKGKGVRGQGS